MMIIKIYEDSNKYTKSSHFKEKYPEEMVHYIEHYGEHFNEKLCNFAVLKMDKYNEVIKPLSKEIVDKLLDAYGIVLENNQLWDYVFVANLGKANYYGSSIADELHLAKYIQDVIDSVDHYEGDILNRWYVDMCKKDIEVDWESMI